MKGAFLFLFWSTNLNFSTTIHEQIVFNNSLSFLHLHPFSFTFTIYLYFYLDFISSTCLPQVLPHFKFRKASLISLVSFGQSSRGHPKQHSLKNSKDVKFVENKIRERERCIRSWDLLRNILRRVKNYIAICVIVSGRYPFSGRNLVSLPVQPKRCTVPV